MVMFVIALSERMSSLTTQMAPVRNCASDVDQEYGSNFRVRSNISIGVSSGCSGEGSLATFIEGAESASCEAYEVVSPAALGTELVTGVTVTSVLGSRSEVLGVSATRG